MNYSKSLDVKGIQIQTHMIYDCITTGMIKIGKKILASKRNTLEIQREI